MSTQSTTRRAVTMAARYLTPETLRAIADAQNVTTIAPAPKPQPKAVTIPVRRPIVDNGDDPSIAHAPRKSRAPKAAPKDWRKRKPSKTQIERNRSTLAQINRMESVLGFRLSTFAALNGGKVCKFNAGEYSDLYQNVLKPLAASLTAEAEALFA